MKKSVYFSYTPTQLNNTEPSGTVVNRGNLAAFPAGLSIIRICVWQLAENG